MFFKFLFIKTESYWTYTLHFALFKYHGYPAQQTKFHIMKLTISPHSLTGRYQNVFNRSPVNGHSDHFKIYINVIDAAINILIHLPLVLLFLGTSSQK